jgi:hypothetical protein
MFAGTLAPLGKLGHLNINAKKAETFLVYGVKLAGICTDLLSRLQPQKGSP